MNALAILVVASACLACGYVFYGRWLAKTWGVDPSKPTPAHELQDGVDYVPSEPYVLLGHHFSSIAGAGPINGPIQAAVFGWVPVLLWVLIGGIFFGAVHDFGALFASLRHKGKTIATIINDNVDNTAKKLFCIFSFLTLVLVVAAFASIVANTFCVDPTKADEANLANQRTAMISMLFILVAVVYGLATRGREIPASVNVLIAIIILVALIAVGYNFPIIALDYTTWMVLIGAYILIASIAPVWILLQPRDFLSSFLLYGMIILSVVGIVGATINGAAASMDIPAFTGFTASNLAVDAAGNAIIDPNTGAQLINKAGASGDLFPYLFITIACGAISGFHSLVSSGTTSKQLKSESHALPIAYGGMLLECLVAVISLCAVGYVFASYTAGDFASPTAVFAGGLSAMIATIPGLGSLQGLSYSLLILAVSAFCLTSLDTATRLGRYMFQEMFVPKGETLESVKEKGGYVALFTHSVFATCVTVALGVGLGMTGYTIIWPLFGAANQLLAALALLAVATWLGNAGKKNAMLYIPMAFMMIVTLTALAQKCISLLPVVMAGGDAFAATVQLIIAFLLFILAIVLAVKGCVTLFGKKKEAAQA